MKRVKVIWAGRHFRILFEGREETKTYPITETGLKNMVTWLNDNDCVVLNQDSFTWSNRLTNPVDGG